MVRDTSIQAYQTITANGLLSKRKLEVYEALYHRGPLTAGELNALLEQMNKRQRHCQPRLNELVRMGVVKEYEPYRECRTSGQMVIIYDVTSKLPVKDAEQRAQRPKGQDLVDAKRDLGMLRSWAWKYQVQLSPGFDKLCAWLNQKQ